MPVTPHVKALSERITGHFLPTPPVRLGVAVSGGSDSLGLLIALNDWAQTGGPALSAVTVDHGLRADAAGEAAEVGRVCAGLNIPHDVLNWQGWDGQGNLPDQARRARYALMANWAETHDIEQVALGHTLDDQAETFLMRLAREAGVDGLAAMSPIRMQGNTVFCRPALQVGRMEFQALLRERGLGWADDPTNEDESYERVRARQVLAALAPLGISANGLSSVAHHLADARGTLSQYVAEAARNLVVLDLCDLVIDRNGFLELPVEIARRLLQSALKWISAAEYGPRGKALERLLLAIHDGRDMTLHGCFMNVSDGQLRIAREFEAVKHLRVDAGQIWDTRWQLTGPAATGVRIAALCTEGLKHCPDWRETGLPHSSMIATPAVWRGAELVAAPVAGLANGWSAQLFLDQEDYVAAILSH